MKSGILVNFLGFLVIGYVVESRDIRLKRQAPSGLGLGTTTTFFPPGLGENVPFGGIGGGQNQGQHGPQDCGENEKWETCNPCEKTCQVPEFVCPSPDCPSTTPQPMQPLWPGNPNPSGKCVCQDGKFRNNQGRCVDKGQCDATPATNPAGIVSGTGGNQFNPSGLPGQGFPPGQGLSGQPGQLGQPQLGLPGQPPFGQPNFLTSQQGQPGQPQPNQPTFGGPIINPGGPMIPSGQNPDNSRPSRSVEGDDSSKNENNTTGYDEHRYHNDGSSENESTSDSPDGAFQKPNFDANPFIADNQDSSSSSHGPQIWPLNQINQPQNPNQPQSPIAPIGQGAQIDPLSPGIGPGGPNQMVPNVPQPFPPNLGVNSGNGGNVGDGNGLPPPPLSQS